MICLCAICEICTRPSTPGNTSTNAPNCTSRLTVPSKTVPLDAFSLILAHGPGKVSLIDNEISKNENNIKKKDELESDLKICEDLINLLEFINYNLISYFIILFYRMIVKLSLILRP